MIVIGFDNVMICIEYFCQASQGVIDIEITTAIRMIHFRCPHKWSMIVERNFA